MIPAQDAAMNIPMDLAEVAARVKEKRQIFKEYNFGPLKDDALKTFYDLAQEYETIENFYRVAVTVIKEFFDLDSRLYLVCVDGRLELTCDSRRGLYPDKTDPPAHIRLCNQAYPEAGSLIIPIRGNLLLVNQLPFYAKDQVIGMLELFPGARIPEADRFFFEKYANRLGYNVHVKIIARQNIQHIRFINSLVADIEHNVIIPNISLSLYLRHLRNKIKNLKELECVCDIRSAECKGKPDAKQVFRSLIDDLEQDYDNLEQHYKGVSLFIESLFRLSHFQKGQFVLRRRTTRVTKEIIEPQLNLHLDKLKERHIEI
ncbi:MAG: hypothetical protein WC443_09405, partial [Desulfobaccales bacterium]